MALERGLQFRTSLAPDAGMLFVFQPPADPGDVAFWMKDTPLPLSIAFVDPSGAVVSLQEMDAHSQNLHRAPKPFAYAVEANRGFFTSHGVAVGDKMTLLPR